MSEKRALLSRLFDEHYDFVHHSLRRLGVHARDLEDLAHDTFVKVFENLDRYDVARPARPWLFAFAFRLASDYRRLARHRTELGADTEAIAAIVPDAEEVAVQRQGARLAETALLAIPFEQRAVFVLYELDETPMKTIAETLEIPVNTAYSRLRLAREAFAAAAARLKEAAS
ncbi:MAG TPA: sigma-70 family RNA polymerase sigma factor [Labilithrix sp.]|nr:sigma-70 family RNA polymerase sigma factor [Labilithrix sp.]